MWISWWVSASAGCGSENGLRIMILHAKGPPECFLTGEPCPDKRMGYNSGMEGTCGFLISAFAHLG